MRKAAFLDRDGTINVDRGYVHRPCEFIFMEGAIEGLKLLREAGFLIIVITNQSGIGRGYFSEQEYLQFQNWIDNELDGYEVHIDGWYYCPHVEEDNCSCRKPKIGLFENAANDFDIDWDTSFAVGDKLRDLTICEIKNMRGYWISSDTEIELSHNIMRVSSLKEAVENFIS
ncbi:D-glycero-alpha-D-manno-heptose-1,7-bisphosphate 7-phosphatase [Butyrivibrio sp. LC3010]|uniref:D-glycero-alpha-D-manno-heptose-1,7-bisphosphate 7-phosphatase n=1 Tax=Butyrivibrio sp. LC3010 TaxID=1280680 RepID=UPI00042160BB|nr:HAD family hydrolase [Butyrivibrio sp. LC3010]